MVAFGFEEYGQPGNGATLLPKYDCEIASVNPSAVFQPAFVSRIAIVNRKFKVCETYGRHIFTN